MYFAIVVYLLNFSLVCSLASHFNDYHSRGCCFCFLNYSPFNLTYSLCCSVCVSHRIYLISAGCFLSTEIYVRCVCVCARARFIYLSFSHVSACVFAFSRNRFSFILALSKTKSQYLFISGVGVETRPDQKTNQQNTTNQNNSYLSRGNHTIICIL